MKYINVVGAGPGGLAAAYLLAKSGNVVRLFEKLDIQSLINHHPWGDSIDNEVLSIVDLPVPERIEGGYTGDYVKTDLTKGLYWPLKKSTDKRVTVDRKELTRHLISNASKAGVEFHFEASDIRLLGDNSEELSEVNIKGIMVGEDTYEADLTIDATGLDGALRKTIKVPYINQEEDSRTLVSAYKVVMAMDLSNDAFEDLKKRFIQNVECDKVGGTWFSQLDKNVVDIGCMYQDENGTKEFARELLFKELAKYSELGGQIYQEGGGVIPFEPTRPVMVANGFALVGESAGTTTPSTGLGMSNAIRSAKMLSDVVNNCEVCSIDTLWSYAFKWYSTIASKEIETLRTIPGDQELRKGLFLRYPLYYEPKSFKKWYDEYQKLF